MHAQLIVSQLLVQAFVCLLLLLFSLNSLVRRNRLDPELTLTSTLSSLTHQWPSPNWPWSLLPMHQTPEVGDRRATEPCA